MGTRTRTITLGEGPRDNLAILRGLGPREYSSGTVLLLYSIRLVT
jgi:hypothetical protein